MDLDTTVFVCGDTDVVAGYVAHAELERAILNACVEEALERWQRLPAISMGSERNSVWGIALRPKGWSWSESRRAWAEHTGESDYHYREELHDPIVIPSGWRKLVKDDFLTPPKKGSSPAIKEARDFCRKYSCESVRGYLERVHGAPHLHFAGLRLITIGTALQEGKVWIISGKGYTVKDERFQPVPLSEYVAMRERNPKEDDVEADAE